MYEFKETPANNRSIAQRKLIYGVGINDADYIIKIKVNGKWVQCPYYQKWKGMIERCCSAKRHEKQPTYIGCTVCDEWLKFSNFKAWMQKKNWKGNSLDKDFKVSGNKVYSPDNCLFVSNSLNLFTTAHNAKRGEYPIGVYLDKHTGKFKSQCKDGTGKNIFLGRFTTPEEAHQSWRKFKKKVGLELAEKQADPEVKAALIHYVEGI